MVLSQHPYGWRPVRWERRSSCVSSVPLSDRTPGFEVELPPGRRAFCGPVLVGRLPVTVPGTPTWCYGRAMRSETGIVGGRNELPPQELVDELMKKLGESFDLETPVGERTLGETIERRLRNLETNTLPSWGGPGSMAQVAKESSHALAFYYRPHLFPEMDPALRLGHQLQFDLLPRSLSVKSPVRITAVLESYCHLSGDLVGWRIEEEEGGLLLWVADVSGHGVRAGLAAAVFQLLVESVDAGITADVVARQVNDRMLAARNPDDERSLFATAFWLEAKGDGSVAYASAGHNPALLRRAFGEITVLGATGLPVGLMPDQRFERRSLELEEDDTLLLFTDGLVEALSPEGEEFGMERVEELLAGPETAPTDVARVVYDAVQEHKGTSLLDDDLTLMVVQAR
jgi:serine phosphatase RsbU (regulator of sigma subunit)